MVNEILRTQPHYINGKKIDCKIAIPKNKLNESSKKNFNAKGNKLDLASWCLWENHIKEIDNEEDDLGIIQLKVLLDAGFSKKKIAEKMGISRATLYRWLKQLENE